jgi:hypothetical protein
MDMEVVERCLAEAKGVFLQDVNIEVTEEELANTLTVVKKAMILGALVKPPKGIADDSRDD